METLDKQSSIERLRMTSRSYNALRRSNIHTVGDLLDYPRNHFSELKHIGQKTLEEVLLVIDRLENQNLTKVIDAEEPTVSALQAKAEQIASDREYSRRIKILITDKIMSLHDIAIEISTHVSAIVPIKEEELYTQILNDLVALARARKFPAYRDHSGIPLLRELGKNTLLRTSIKRIIMAVLVRYPYGATIEEVMADMPTPMGDEYFLLGCLADLRLTKRIMVTPDGRFLNNFDSVADYVRNLQNLKCKTILTGRLAGRSLDEVGLEVGLTRERIRQLQNKCLSQAPYFREDVYHLIYERYNISKQDFMLGFDEDELVYHYLNIRYKRGTREVSELRNDLFVPKFFREAGARIASQYFVTVGEEQVLATRNSIVAYILRTEVKESIHTSELTTMYKAFIEKLGLEKNPKIHGLDRAYFNRLANDRNVLWNLGNRLRYYDIDIQDYRALFEGVNLLSYKNVEISTKKLFDENPDLMEDYDIRDEYELHNLLKKICVEDKYSHIIFRRMPHLHIGRVNRDQQIKDLLAAAAPIRQDEFIDLYADTFGIHQQTILTNYLSSIENYLYNGVYRFDIETMSQRHREELRRALPDDFYRLTQVREIFDRLLPDEDPNQLNAHMFKLIGFNSYSEYIIRDVYPTASEYFQHLLLAKDKIDTNLIPQELRQLNAYLVELYRLRSTLEIVEYQPSLYANKHYLARLGLGEAELKRFTDWLLTCSGPEYFTMDSFMREFADENPLSAAALNVKESDPLYAILTDYFYASVTIADTERFSYRRLGGNRIIRRSGQKFQLLDFIHSLLAEHGLDQASQEQIHRLLADHYAIDVPVKALPSIG